MQTVHCCRRISGYNLTDNAHVLLVFAVNERLQKTMKIFQDFLICFLDNGLIFAPYQLLCIWEQVCSQACLNFHHRPRSVIILFWSKILNSVTARPYLRQSRMQESLKNVLFLLYLFTKQQLIKKLFYMSHGAYRAHHTFLTDAAAANAIIEITASRQRPFFGFGPSVHVLLRCCLVLRAAWYYFVISPFSCCYFF